MSDSEVFDRMWSHRPHVRRRRWPRVAMLSGTVRNAMPISLSSLYMCDESSGNLIDSVGSSNLTAAGTPVYGDLVEGKRGVTFNSATDGFNADVHDLAAASGLYFHVALHSTTPDSFVFGRTKSDGSVCAFVGVATPSSGTLRGVINSTGANRTLGPTTDVRGKTMLVILQVDRAAGLARMYMKERGGAATTTSGSIATHTTLTSTGQTFGLCNFGGVTTQTGGFTTLLLGVATGAQTEGTAVLDDIAGRLHF